jgi:hypothetical protein
VLVETEGKRRARKIGKGKGAEEKKGEKGDANASNLLLALHVLHVDVVRCASRQVEKHSNKSHCQQENRMDRSH